MIAILIGLPLWMKITLGVVGYFGIGLAISAVRKAIRKTRGDEETIMFTPLWPLVFVLVPLAACVGLSWLLSRLAGALEKKKKQNDCFSSSGH